MHIDGYCPGCGGGEGNQSCAIARCSLQHEKVEYCFQCPEYPCPKYSGIDDYDSFITHRNRRADMQKAAQLGMEDYNSEQREKAEILTYLLEHFNDGRRKSFFCVTINLLELSELQAVLKDIASEPRLFELPPKERASLVVQKFQKLAAQKNLELKLRRKPKEMKK